MPVALLITVLFSYLSWREANLARTNQDKFFTASNSPNLEAKAYFIRPSFPILTISLKNIGESTAYGVCITIVELGGDHVYRDTCQDDDVLKNIAIDKGELFEFPIIPANDFEEQVGLIPKEAMMTNQLDYLPDDYGYYLIAIITYYDITGTQKSELINIAFKDV